MYFYVKLSKIIFNCLLKRKITYFYLSTKLNLLVKSEKIGRYTEGVSNLNFNNKY
jgi:hypothetical protein